MGFQIRRNVKKMENHLRYREDEEMISISKEIGEIYVWHHLIKSFYCLTCYYQVMKNSMLKEIL